MTMLPLASSCSIDGSWRVVFARLERFEPSDDGLGEVRVAKRHPEIGTPVTCQWFGPL